MRLPSRVGVSWTVLTGFGETVDVGSSQGHGWARPKGVIKGGKSH